MLMVLGVNGANVLAGNQVRYLFYHSRHLSNRFIKEEANQCLVVSKKQINFRQYHQNAKKSNRRSRQPKKKSRSVAMKEKVDSKQNNNNDYRRVLLSYWKDENKRNKWLQAGLRLPFWMGLMWIVTEEYPFFGIDAMAGPSMIPTIHPTGEVYFRFYPLQDYKVDDVVVLQVQQGEYACKRIVATEGMKVLINNSENDDNNNVILPVHNNYDISWKSQIDESSNKLTIPSNHVWVEGDFPIMSVDSRHYGPIPISQLKGKVLLRLWPLYRKHNDVSMLSRTSKPNPPLELSQVLEQKQIFNLFVVEKKGSVNEKTQ